MAPAAAAASGTNKLLLPCTSSSCGGVSYMYDKSATSIAMLLRHGYDAAPRLLAA
jgi:hypothetical protein